MPGSTPSQPVRRIVDRPEHHDAPGAWDWAEAERRRRDTLASHAARRFLDSEPVAPEDCWRCEAAAAAEPIGLCSACLDELRET